MNPVLQRELCTSTSLVTALEGRAATGCHFGDRVFKLKKVGFFSPFSLKLLKFQFVDFYLLVLKRIVPRNGKILPLGCSTITQFVV